jgi:hypothetical protein
MRFWIRRPQKPKLGMFVETHALIPAFSPRRRGILRRFFGKSIAAGGTNFIAPLEDSQSRLPLRGEKARVREGVLRS